MSRVRRGPDGHDIEVLHRTLGDLRSQIAASKRVEFENADAVVINTAKRTYPAVDETKLAGIETGAQANVDEVEDNVFRIVDDAAKTKEIAFDASAISLSTTRTISMPDADVDLSDVGMGAALGRVWPQLTDESMALGTSSAPATMTAERVKATYYSSQAGVPSTTPGAIGIFNGNTSTGDVYISRGVASSADWKLLSDGRDIAADGAKLDLITGTNTGDEPAATTSVVGVVELASQAEAEATADPLTALTPLSIANLVKRLPKAFCTFDPKVSPTAEAGAYNIASVVRATTGLYTINFTDDLPSATYSITITQSDTANVPHLMGFDTRAVGSFNLFIKNASGSLTDNAEGISIVVHSYA